MHVKLLMHFMILLFIHLLLIRKSKEKIVPCGGAVRVELKKIPPRNEHDQVAPLFGLSAPPQNVTCHRALTRSLSLSLEWSSRAPCVIFIALLYREPLFPETPLDAAPHSVCSEYRVALHKIANYTIAVWLGFYDSEVLYAVIE